MRDNDFDNSGSYNLEKIALKGGIEISLVSVAPDGRETKISSILITKDDIDSIKSLDEYPGLPGSMKE